MEAGDSDQMLRQLSLHDLLLDQLVESMETRGSSALGVAFCLSGVVLEGYDLSLELLVELLQLLLVTEDIIAVERHLFSLTIGLLLLFLHLFLHLIEHLKELAFLDDWMLADGSCGEMESVPLTHSDCWLVWRSCP